MHQRPDDLETFALLHRGDSTALGNFVHQWLPVVVQWCGRLGGTSVDPEDAAHDVFIIALRKISTVYDADHLGPWLFGITRRVLAQHRRRAWFRRWIPGAAVEAVEENGPARLYDVSETARQVQEALETLDVREKEVLVLCLLEERPDSEVSRMLGIPIGTVKSRLRRGREQFLTAARARGLGPAGLAVGGAE